MKTIQKPKRMWQKKKDYNKKKLIRKIQRRNKTSFDSGKNESYSDLKTNRPIIIGPGLLSMFTPKPKGYKEGKDCFDIGTDNGQQIIYQDGDQYFAGPSESAATIKVTPYIQRLPNDKSTWDFVDDSGKLYTTKYSDEQLKYLYGQNTPGSEFYTWTDRSGKQHRQMKIIPVSPVDPVGEMAVETAIGYPLFKGVGMIGRQFLKDYARDFAFTKLGSWTRNKIAGKEAADVLNKNINAYDGTVGPEYFDSKYKWYRWSETPEIQSLRRYGKNITTRDTDGIGGTPDSWRTDAMDNFSKSKEGYWYKADRLPEDHELRDLLTYMKNPNRNIASDHKYGSAHGNRSQGAYGRYWDGSLSTSGIGHLGLLEGDTGATIPLGITRKHFIEKPIEDIIPGSRIGFKTGEMPMDNLSWFEKLPNGRFSYKGLVLPDKRITTTNNSANLIKPTLDDATYLTNESLDALQDVAINTKDKEYLSNLIKHNFQQKSNGNGIFGVYHATDRGPFNQFEPTKGHMGGMVEPFYHFGGKSTKEFFERMPGYKIKKFDINGKNLITVDDFTHERPMDFVTELYRRGYISRDRLSSYRDLLYSREYLDDPHSFVQRVLNDLNSNGIRYVNQVEGKGTESIGIPDAKNIKLSNLFTYDDNGNLIPLSKRADFTKNDVRHNSGKDIHIKKANRGKFTEAANEHNMGVQEFARQVLSAPKGKYSPTLRKRANFARNFAH